MIFSLKLKVALAATAMVVLAIGSVGLVRNGQLQEDVEKVFLSEQEAMASSLADNLSDKLELHISVLEQAAKLANADDLKTDAARKIFMARASGLQSIFDSVAIIAVDGDILLNEPPRPPGPKISVADRDYFKQAMATGRTAISSPLVSRGATGGPAVVIAAPVQDKAGRVVAVLAGILNLERPNLLGGMNLHPIGQTGHVEVTTRGPSGVYVVHPDRSMLLQSTSKVTTNADDLITRVALRSVDWQLHVVLPAWEARAPAKEAQRRLNQVLVVMASIAALIAWVGAYWLLRPLTTLLQAIRSLRIAPDTRVDLPIGGNDERGELAREFQTLIHEVQFRQQELTAIGASAPLGLFRTNSTGDVTWANQAFMDILGLAPTEVARGWLLLLPPERRDASWQAWVNAVTTAAPQKAQMRMHLRNGLKRSLVIRSAPLFHQGQLNGHVGTVADITERVEGARAQAMLTAVLDASSDYVVQTDTTGKVTYMNPATREAVGMRPDEPVDAHNFNEFNTPETMRLFESVILPAVRAHGVWLGETTVYGAGRKVMPVSHLVIGHRGKNGRLERFSAVMRDISLQREAQRELERQTATLQSIAESMPAIVAVVGADERYRYVNAEFERWYNKPRDQIVGSTLEEALGPVDYERSRPWVKQVLAGESVQFERVYGEKASYSHLSVSYIPLRLADGVVDGFIGVAMNISLHRQKEDQLTQLAQKDALTGLLNRAGFESYLELRFQERQEATLALLYVDLDHFKPVNDTHGHPVGDKLLQMFADRMRGLVRPSDAVARLGGDEFALVLYGVRAAGHANAIAEKVLQAAHAPFELDGFTLHIGASIGVAVGATQEGGWQELVARADKLLYKAKAGGRGRLVSAPEA
jgi:diguanylate cyclase (GGDEF)-like protein/PAS domain S-box-containing protein